MNRRGFLGSILVACMAPAIVRADSLMRIVPTTTTILPVAAEGLATEAALVAMIQKVWQAGGEPEIIRCSPEFARVIDAEFTGIATRFSDASPPLSVYVSDYGCSRIVVERGLPRDFIVESPGGFADAIF